MCCGRYNLEGLYLAENNFTGAIAVSIPNCSKLTFISHGYNKFSGGIPISLGWLHLSREDLSVRKSVEWGSPNFNWNPSSSVEKFYAENCGIKGNIPWSIGSLSNHLTGFIPSTMNGFLAQFQNASSWENPDTVRLVNESLSGNIASTIGSLEYLMLLSLATNSLQGQVMDIRSRKSGEDYCAEELKCISSIMEVALNCSMDSPKERRNIEDALAA
ncbi:brassinosteroid LRR receptor kinase-like [Coffea eugenioides]|uniref:brassinosteroid LRR receptor kinase-like n=1 Tax=Coffea eugenioides TaxID=49369 RepID=UPI000F60522C|nr:brassinosteroid LRR receptor kinase-like [Coffea eugenioides]